MTTTTSARLSGALITELMIQKVSTADGAFHAARRRFRTSARLSEVSGYGVSHLSQNPRRVGVFVPILLWAFMDHIAVFGYLLFKFSCFLPKLHFSGVQYHVNSTFGLFLKPCSVFQFHPFCEVCFYAKKTVTDCRVGHLRDRLQSLFTLRPYPSIRADCSITAV